MTVVALSPGANVSWLGSLTRIVTTLVLPVALAWGFVHFLHGRLHRGDIREVPAIAAAPGPITLRVKLPGHHAGIAEPIVVLGRSGQAVMVYLKLFPHNQVRIGIEFWGRRSDESALFSVPCAEAQLAITCFLPALFPPEGDPQWGGVPARLQTLRRTRYYLTVDRVVRLTAPVDYPMDPHPNLYLGLNPLGGSIVSDRFTGSILNASAH